MEHIQEVLTGIIKDLEKKKSDTPTKIIETWKTIVGERIATHTKPYRMHKKILYVNVDSAPWVYELNQKHKQSLVKKINTCLGKTAVSNIRFRIGEVV